MWGGLDAAAPGARQHALDRDAVKTARLADARACSRPSLRQIALRAAVLQAKALRIAEPGSVRGCRMSTTCRRSERSHSSSLAWTCFAQARIRRERREFHERILRHVAHDPSAAFSTRRIARRAATQQHRDLPDVSILRAGWQSPTWTRPPGKFAQGGAGAVFVEATAVEKRGRIHPCDTGIWDDGISPSSREFRIRQETGRRPCPPARATPDARRAWRARVYGKGPLTQADFDRGDRRGARRATEQPIDPSWIVPRAFNKATSRPCSRLSQRRARA